MSRLGDGGQAFPQGIAISPMGESQYGAEGMSLRDWFAGQALAGLLAFPHTPDVKTPEAMAQLCVSSAYRYADAMLLERRR